MRRTLHFLTAFSLLVLHGATSGVLVAGAQSCASVADEAGVISVEEVEAAVADLAGQADAKVYVFESVPDADIDAAAANLISACFADGPDGRQFDLVLIAVSIDDRLATIQYGGAHNVELGDSAATIRQNVINPRFADGDFTGGLVDGLQAIDDLLGPLDAAASDSGASDPAASDPARATEGDPSGTSGSGFPWGLTAIGGAAAAGGAGVLISRRRSLSNARNVLESESQDPRVSVGVARERAARLTAQAELWERVVLGGTREELLARTSDGRRAAGDTERAVSLFDGALPNGIGAATAREVTEGTARLRELEASLERFNASLDRVEFFGARIDRLRVTLPRKRDQLRSEVGQALSLADERERAGWKVDEPRRRLVDADAQLELLAFDSLGLDLLSISDVVEFGEAELFAARHDLQTLEDTMASLQAWAAQLDESEKMERRRVIDTRAQLAVLGQHHAPESWRWAGQHIDDAFEALDQAATQRINAVGQHLENQQWEATGRSLEEAGLALMLADDRLDDVDSLFVSLETAREHAPAVLAQASHVVKLLKTFVATHDDDLPQRFDVQPVEAELAIDGLRAELTKPLPNFLRVAQTGDRLARQIDQLLHEATEEQARVAALRREVERERARAYREIERAERAVGWELIRSRDSKELDTLKDRLAVNESDLARELQSVQIVADDAVQIRSDVIAKRRRNSTWVVVGGSTGGGSWGSGSSGGGFSGGGGGFSGGGGGFSGGGGGGGSFGGGGSSGSW